MQLWNQQVPSNQPPEVSCVYLLSFNIIIFAQIYVFSVLKVNLLFSDHLYLIQIYHQLFHYLKKPFVQMFNNVLHPLIIRINFMISFFCCCCIYTISSILTLQLYLFVITDMYPSIVFYNPPFAFSIILQILLYHCQVLSFFTDIRHI